MAVLTAIDPQLLDAYRRWGYLQAELDPLGRLRPESGHPDLPPQGEGIDQLRRWYCGPLAVEYMHIPDPARRQWIRAHRDQPPAVDRGRILDL